MADKELTKWGDYYWEIALPSHYEMVHADDIEVKDGCLLLFGHLQSGERFLMQGYAPEQWVSFAAASVLTGDRVAVEHVVARQESHQQGSKL